MTPTGQLNVQVPHAMHTSSSTTALPLMTMIANSAVSGLNSSPSFKRLFTGHTDSQIPQPVQHVDSFTFLNSI